MNKGTHMGLKLPAKYFFYLHNGVVKIIKEQVLAGWGNKYGPIVTKHGFYYSDTNNCLMGHFLRLLIRLNLLGPIK